MRMNASELDPRESGSVNLRQRVLNEADEVVQRALEACEEELKEENAEVARQKDSYRKYMTQGGLSHRLHV